MAPRWGKLVQVSSKIAPAEPPKSFNIALFRLYVRFAFALPSFCLCFARVVFVVPLFCLRIALVSFLRCLRFVFAFRIGERPRRGVAKRLQLAYMHDCHVEARMFGLELLYVLDILCAQMP